jgi:hypothetical protein
MLKVTAWMASPIAGDVPHLDGLLEFEMSQRLGLAQKVRRDLPAPPQGEIHIPMVRRQIGRWNVACCSSPIYLVRHEWRENFAKRLAVEHADLLATNQRLVVATGNQVYKSYRLPLRIRDCERVVYLCLGHRRPVLKLLRSVSSIGKKREIGYGRIREWTAEEVEGEAWWFAPSTAGPVLMRPLPVEGLPANLIGARQDFGACTPPYWHGDRYGEIVVPC